jgi:hypothetical protein
MRRIMLVTGPPAAGKTTYAQSRAQPGDTILDQDEIGAARMRAALSQITATAGTTWVIRCAPGPTARRHLADQLGAEIVHLVDDERVITRRAVERAKAQGKPPRAAAAAVAKWYAIERADHQPGAPKPGGFNKLGSTTSRGYGWGHQKARAQALRDLRDGDPCSRCGGPMYRAESKALDLDHGDDRTTYRGLAHAHCNRKAGQAVAVARATQREQTSVINSRAW